MSSRRRKSWGDMEVSLCFEREARVDIEGVFDERWRWGRIFALVLKA